MKSEIVMLFLLSVNVFCAKNRTAKQKEALIILEEMDNDQRNPENRAGFQDEICPSQSICIPISSCPLLEDLLDKSCLASNKYFKRLTALTCGWVNGEARVCCPPGGLTPLGPAKGPLPGQAPQGVQSDEGVGNAPSQPSPSETCGRPIVQARNYEGLGTHPWVVRIGFKNKATSQLRFPCSGSIISKRLVLTAAHCALAKAEGYKLSSITAGEWDTATNPDCGDMFCGTPIQTIPISHVIVHPGYDRKIYRHDIALVALREDIQYTLTSLPICLAESPPPTPAEGIRAQLSAWGRLAGQRNPTTKRQQLSVPLLPLDDCARVYSASAPLSTSQLCAGAEPGRDACAGFGGAPLVMNIDFKYTQIGIVSFGSEKCGSPGIPSVYTDIYSYSKWIKDNSPPT